MLGRASLLPLIMFLLVCFLSAPANANMWVGIGQALGLVPEASEIPDAGTDTIDLGECHLDSKEHCDTSYGAQYNDCDGDLYSCRSCGVGVYVPFDVDYPVIEDCRNCPSWTRNVINSVYLPNTNFQFEVFVKCTALCEKQSSNALEDIRGDGFRSDACHRLVGSNRECTTCPDGKYRNQIPPPVTTWNAPDRAHYSVRYECALCLGNTMFRSHGSNRRLLDFAGDIGFESGLAGVTELCEAARCTECPVNCASEIWLDAGSCQATTTDSGHDYGIASSDKTSCNPCRLDMTANRQHASESPWFQWVPPGGTSPQCRMCASGRDLEVQQRFRYGSDLYQYKECRMTDEYNPTLRTGDENDCCRLCPLNMHRALDHPGPCEHCLADETARDWVGDPAVLGGVSCAPCGRGFKLIYCTMQSEIVGVCFERNYGNQEHWRVCVPCDNNEYFLSTEQGGCARCDPFASVGSLARGDRRSADDSRCEFCSACSASNVDLYAKNTIEWENKMRLSFEARDYRSAVHTYQSQTCDALERRELTTDIHALTFVLQGTDKYKPTPASAPTPVPALHAVMREGQLTTSCDMRHCAEACTGFFEYAEGCGPQESDPYVRNATAYLRLSQLNEAVTLTHSNIYGATTGWELAPEGRCELCIKCSNGQYNSACGEASAFALGLAAGVCAPCDLACADSTTDASAASYWKDHPRGLLGCSWPADLDLAPLSGHGLPTEPYKCRVCPRWIQRPVIGQDYYEMYTPEACGNTLRYHTWGFAAPCDGADCDCELQNIDNAHAGPLRTVTRCVRSLAEHQADPTTDAVVVDSFRRHLSAPRPYCPPHYYFDTHTCGDFIAQSEPCAFNSADTCGLEPAYSHKCCKLCAVCDVAEGRRNGPNYRDCSGATALDTQAGENFDNCVSGDACPTNYFRSTDSSGAASCEACSTCTAGEL